MRRRDSVRQAGAPANSSAGRSCAPSDRSPHAQTPVPWRAARSSQPLRGNKLDDRQMLQCRLQILSQVRNRSLRPQIRQGASTSASRSPRPQHSGPTWCGFSAMRYLCLSHQHNSFNLLATRTREDSKVTERSRHRAKWMQQRESPIERHPLLGAQVTGRVATAHRPPEGQPLNLESPAVFRRSVLCKPGPE